MTLFEVNLGRLRRCVRLDVGLGLGELNGGGRAVAPVVVGVGDQRCEYASLVADAVRGIARYFSVSIVDLPYRLCGWGWPCR